MKYKDFENNLGDAFSRDSVAIDTDALIASLNLPISQEDKKAFPWYKLMGAILLIALMGITYGMNNGTIATNDFATSSMLPLPKQEVAIPVTVDNPEEKITSKSSEPIKEVKSNTLNNKRRSYFAENKANAKNPIAVSSDLKSTVSKSKNPENNTPKVIISSNQISGNTINNTNLSKVIINKPAETKPEINVAAINSIMSSPSTEVDRLSGLGEPQCPTFSIGSSWNYSLLAEAGVMKPIKELTNVDGSPSQAFDLRNESENSKEAIQFGLYGKVSRDDTNFYLRGGAAYTRITEQMREEYSYIERDTSVGLISITTSMSGDTITAIYGDIVTETTISGTSQKHYFLHLWDLPIALGHETDLVNGFYAGGEIGAQFNIKTSGSGLIYRDANDYANLSEVISSKTSVGLSYFGGVHIGKHLSGRSSIQLSARFRYYPDSFSTIDPNVNQKYNLVGLHAGYVRRF